MVTGQGKIRELFLDGPPPTPEEVRRITLSQSQEQSSDELVALMASDSLLQHHFGLFLEVAKLLDISNRRRDAMMMIVKDKRRERLSRQFALLGLTSGQPQEAISELFQYVDQEIIAATSDMPFVDMLTAIQLEPSLACDLTSVLLGASHEEQEFILLHHVGRVRREVGTPASMAYAHALAEPELSHLHPHMVEALIQERDSAAGALLTELRDGAEDDESRRRFQAALLRLGTLQIEDAPGRNAPEARTYVSICDGQGAYFLFCRYKMSEAHWATASCCIRAAADIRDAFVLPQQPQAEFEEMLERLTEQRLIYTEVPPAQASALFSEALSRTVEMGRKLPDSSAPVVNLFERIVPEAVPPVQGPTNVSIMDMFELMDTPHFDTWFFDEGDLAGHGIDSPKGAPNAAWYRDAAAAVANTPLKDRLLAMLDHMVKWYIWVGDPKSAGMLFTAKKQAVSNFKRSSVVRVMLERSLYDGEDDDPLGALVDDVVSDRDLYGSDSLRSTLRRRYFNDLKRPSGRHMAELDFMEVAYHQLHLAFSSFPGEKRPREDDVLDLARETAREFVKSLLHGRDAGAMVENLDKTVAARCELSGRERAELIHIVADGMFGFIESACKKCEVQCLDAPRKGMADEFFSSLHPTVK